MHISTERMRYIGPRTFLPGHDITSCLFAVQYNFRTVYVRSVCAPIGLPFREKPYFDPHRLASRAIIVLAPSPSVMEYLPRSAVLIPVFIHWHSKSLPTTTIAPPRLSFCYFMTLYSSHRVQFSRIVVQIVSVGYHLYRIGFKYIVP